MLLKIPVVLSDRTKNMKKNLLVILLITGVMGLADESLKLQYYVPLPEKTFSGDWQYLLEAGVQGEGTHEIQIVGYNVLGQAVIIYEPILIDGQGGFSFSPFSKPEFKTASIQSLVLESDVAVSGFLWVFNEETGQLNGVSLNLNSSPNVVIPQIGTNYFMWKSGFSLMGIGPFEGSSTNLDFRFFDQGNRSQETELWSNFGHHAFIKKTPYFDVFLGDLDHPVLANWGQVISQNANFNLAGYQTFSRVDGSLQTCAFELNQPPVSEGTFPLVSIGDTTSHWVTLTNAEDFEVQAVLTLYFTQTLLEEEVDIDLFDSASIEVVIPAQGRLSGVLGVTWFDQVYQQEGVTPMRFSFKTLPRFEEGEEGETLEIPNDVYALSFVSHGQSALGAAYIPGSGNFSEFWLTGQMAVSRSLFIQNTSDTNINVELTIFNPSGKISGYNRRELKPSALWTVVEDDLRDLFGEYEDASFRFQFSCVDGLFSINLLGQQGRDIALVNLPIQVVSPVEEPN